MEDGRIAVIGIGDSSVFDHVNSICASLKIPFVAIKWDSIEESAFEAAKELAAASHVDEAAKPNPVPLVPLPSSSHADSSIHRPQDNIVNIHPPANKLMKVCYNYSNCY